MDKILSADLGTTAIKTCLVDAEGRVINRDVQFTQLDQEIEKALAQKVASRNR